MSKPPPPANLARAKEALASTGKEGHPLSPKTEALIEVLYVTALADEDFGTKERDLFTENVVGLSNGRLKADDVKGVILKLKFKAKEGRATRLAAIVVRLPTEADREHAFALACSMATADGVVLEEETALIDEVAAALHIDAERARDILDMAKSVEPEA